MVLSLKCSFKLLNRCCHTHTKYKSVKTLRAIPFYVQNTNAQTVLFHFRCERIENIPLKMSSFQIVQSSTFSVFLHDSKQFDISHSVYIWFIPFIPRFFFILLRLTHKHEINDVRRIKMASLNQDCAF